MASEESQVTDVCKISMGDGWHHRNGGVGNFKNQSFHWSNHETSKTWQDQLYWNSGV